MVARHRLSAESGSGTVLSISLIAVIVATLGFSQLAFNFTHTRIKNQNIADQIAVAASDSVRGLSGGYPCEVAKSMANRNKVTLDECRMVGFESFIRIHSDALGVEVGARARAGPSY